MLLTLFFINISMSLAALEQKDDGYYFSHYKMDVDMETFEQLNVFWSKDKNKVFYKWYETDVVDPITFEVINYEVGKDIYNVYWNSQFFEGAHAVKGADPKAFELYSSTGIYGRDQDSVFILLKSTTADQRIYGADPETFQSIAAYYSKDKNNVYYQNKAVGGADPESFIVYNSHGTDYAIDKDYAYCSGEKLSGSDATTFEVLTAYNAKDKNNYYSGCDTTNIDPISIIELNRNYKKDDNNAYFGSHVIGQADAKSFEVIQDIYAIDKYNVFYMYDILDGADSKTFHYINHGYGKDDKYVFYQRNMIKGADPDSFKTDRDNYGSDNWSSYFKDTVISRIETERKIKNQSMYQNLKGKILLEVEKNGEAWYLSPGAEKVYYLGRPIDAFRVMRELGLGIAEKDYNSFGAYAPGNLSGKILLRVEANGEAYYVNPEDLRIHYLGRPSDAFKVMRELGLGISNTDFESL